MSTTKLPNRRALERRCEVLAQRCGSGCIGRGTQGSTTLAVHTRLLATRIDGDGRQMRGLVGGESDLLALSLRLAETPCGSLYKRHISPDRELAALVASTTD